LSTNVFTTMIIMSVRLHRTASALFFTLTYTNFLRSCCYKCLLSSSPLLTNIEREQQRWKTINKI
jgi:hypothetical protein